MLWIGGPVPRGSDAITLGRLIVVRDGAERSAYLLRHEQVHVRQWRRYGVIGFLVRYGGAYARGRLARRGHHAAYARIPFEIEADWIARRMIGTSPRDSVSEASLAR